VQLCEQMVFQGAHPDDASDAVMGLSDEERLQVTIAMTGIKAIGVAPWKEQYLKAHPNTALNNVRRLSGVLTMDGKVEPSYFSENKPAVRSRSNSHINSRMTSNSRSRRASLPPSMNKRRGSQISS